ncbi:hypothetical protein KO527_12990 [Pseudoalteromonas sp. C2R02]|uniref:hypothetical protein n=1 Tax=Pseudoalteromonas sp. C2R02 TaxID=2841565 RepID=UPI001C0A5580|nr:hypothetical protein [Pseudoalteromonas sp. C2R02]MBU2970266.1 hypothetical protein [Pseudoalteromonas sp. C2R02]
MFELFLVMMALTSPILVAIFVRNYFNYKSEVNQKLLALQKENDTNTTIVMQKKLDILTDRVIVLEKIVTNSNIDLSQEISRL